MAEEGTGLDQAKPLEKMTVKDLRELAKEMPEISGVHGMMKEELVGAIKTAKGIPDEVVKRANGAIMELKKKIKALYIFIAPPSMGILEERLKNRKTESPETLKKRLKWAQYEMEQAKHYDYTIVNDDLETAYEALKSIIVAKNYEGGNHGTR